MDAATELLAAWARGDRAAGERFVASQYDAVCRFFATKGGAYADDLVQQTFMACASSLGGWSGTSSGRAFLFGIARNVLFEHIRRRVRDGRRPTDFRTSALADLMPGIQTQASLQAERQRLALALQRIPLELQVVVELFYWEELSVGDLAQVVGVPPGTVKSRLFRARQLLKVALSEGAADQAALLSQLKR